MIRAAGILFRTTEAEPRVLFLQRAGGGDHPGAWCTPGGKLEGAETPEEAACRETREECGQVPDGERSLLARTVAPAEPTSVDVPGTELSAPVVPEEQVDFSTFLQDVPEPFDVTLDEENTAFTWAPAGSPPQPLHPGVAVALRCLSGNELAIARMMADGELTSPQHYGNVALFDIRITGTGVAYRKALDEYCYRAPENYLTAEFLARCNGLPVLWEHPARATLDSKEWSDRVVGTTFLPYVKGDEVWAIVKIYDDGAIAEMTRGGLSTSPTVSFGSGVVIKDASTKMQLEDGTKLLIEGDPPLLDHIAICEKGVWDKGGDPAGVNTAKADSAMDEKEMADAIAKADAARRDAEAKLADATAKADAARADADGRAAKLMDALADMSKRMDAWEEEKKADKARKDEGEKEEAKANEAADRPGAGDPKEVEAKSKDDKAKKDAEDEKKQREDKKDEDEKKERDDKAKADSERYETILREVAALKDATHRSDADYAALAHAQTLASSVYSQFGRDEPRPAAGESVLTYRRRLATELKTHSPQWKSFDLLALGDANAFNIAETQIYADAVTAARNPASIADDTLREIHVADPAGRKIVDFVGNPKSWMQDFSQPPLRARFNRPNTAL